MDKRTDAKIHAQNAPENTFKLRFREIASGYSLNYEVCRKGLDRRRGTLSLTIKGTAGAISNDSKIIMQAKKKLNDLERQFKAEKNLTFMDEDDKNDIVQEASFMFLFKEYYTAKYKKKNTKKNFSNALSHLIKFNAGKPNILIKDITKPFCFKFKNYLDRQDLLNSSKNSYLQKFKEFVGFLVENNHIVENPIPRKFSFKNNITDRQYLEEEEFISLAKTPPPNNSFVVCKAFIFGCLSGFRWEDLKDLEFSDIHGDEIKIKQGKTEEFVEFTLPPQAIKIVVEMKKYGNSHIFEGIGSNSTGNIKIKQWVRNAGIEKVITWHVARHTFACLLLLKGVDIYHVSKLLGHTSIKSTMKYLHVLKKHKTMATEALAGIGLD